MSPFPEDLWLEAQKLVEEAAAHNIRIATAESCTGGLVAALLTEIAGSSSVVERGFIVYSNRAKEEMLHVPGDVLADYGAVSEPVARALAEGALHESRANLTIAITGIAGPSGATGFKPVGLVHFASAKANRPICHEEHLFGDIGRSQIRLEAVRVGVRMLRDGVMR
ncbi:CinA family protein [Candidatus Phycosocius spiralis]|uniref:Competence damage-inducible protein A n=1 Tax=Candidatus Phycosocius spiralis TaxID=2815099 RepID=A0ABQ4PSJ1_9PROT|nr:CinA family protein [Candidatus Phycosocius spiralis]GIU65974.1 competence damage-inducible protein A [Candidatus Phycosocius spiralis]